MKILSRVAVIIGCLLLLNSCRYLFHRWTVLKAPIRFEEGFSTTNRFTVDRKIQYALGIEFPKDIPTSFEGRMRPDEFSAEFSIKCGDTVVLEGRNSSEPGQGTAWRKGHTIRFVGYFEAEPGKLYTLLFRIVRVSPSFASTNGIVTISVFSFF